MRRLSMAIFVAAVICSCGGRNSGNKVPNPVSPHEKIVSNPVAPDTVKNKESNIVGTGKVRAQRYADLSFGTALPITSVKVIDGQRVRAGQTLASLDAEQMRLEVEKAKKRLESANLRKMDVVVSQGYDPENLAEVPAGVITLAETKSEYSLAQLNLQEAQKNLKKVSITAPFSGVVANLDMEVGVIATPGKPVCRVIDDSKMQVEFSIMEHDLAKVKQGTKLYARPFATPEKVYNGTVTQINPIVSQNGSITIRAEITGSDGLYDGMNVNIEVCED